MFFRKNYKTVIAIEIIALCLLTVGYIFQICQLNEKHIIVSKNEKELSSLQEQSRGLESYISLKIAQLDIDLVAQNSNFEKIDKIDYIQANPVSMVKR